MGPPKGPREPSRLKAGLEPRRPPRQKLHALRLRHGFAVSGLGFTHRLSIVVPFWGSPYRILNVSHKKALLWSLWARFRVWNLGFRV